MQFALDVVFGQIKTSITASIKRYEACVENGKKGGRPKTTNNLKNQTKNQTKNQSNNQSGNQTDNQRQNQRHNLNKNYNLNDNSYNSVSEVGPLGAPTSSTHDGKEEKKSEEDLPPYMRGWRPVIE
jgi:hypothetical protein